MNNLNLAEGCKQVLPKASLSDYESWEDYEDNLKSKSFKESHSKLYKGNNIIHPCTITNKITGKVTWVSGKVLATHQYRSSTGTFFKRSTPTLNQRTRDIINSTI